MSKLIKSRPLTSLFRNFLVLSTDPLSTSIKFIVQSGSTPSDTSTIKYLLSGSSTTETTQKPSICSNQGCILVEPFRRTMEEKSIVPHQNVEGRVSADCSKIFGLQLPG